MAVLLAGMAATPVIKAQRAYPVWELALLTLLYTLQGVPLGLCQSIPFLLQAHLSLTDVGFISTAFFPYSIKLLWSPFVDAFYVPSMGRRKSWIVPVQLLVGVSLLLLSSTIQAWVEGERVLLITFTLFLVIFLVATQDIAVDGWALTLLEGPFVQLSSTCQAAGQSIGFFLAYPLFLALNSAQFCNRWVRSVPVPDRGLVELDGFLFFWGWVFIAVTLGVWLLKTEKPTREQPESVSLTYAAMRNVLCLKSVRSLMVVLLTCRVAFACEGIVPLLLTKNSIPRENLALISALQLPFSVVNPMIVGRWMTTGQKLDPWLMGYPLRVGMTVIGMVVVYYFCSGDVQPENISMWTYALLFVVMSLFSFCSDLMFVSQCGFFATISDPAIGGTYMTLLNTVTNFGNWWPSVGKYWLVDRLGFHAVATACVAYGMAWFVLMRGRVNKLQRMRLEGWRVKAGHIV